MYAAPSCGGPSVRTVSDLAMKPCSVSVESGFSRSAAGSPPKYLPCPTDPKGKPVARPTWVRNTTGISLGDGSRFSSWNEIKQSLPSAIMMSRSIAPDRTVRAMRNASSPERAANNGSHDASSSGSSSTTKAVGAWIGRILVPFRACRVFVRLLNLHFTRRQGADIVDKSTKSEMGVCPLDYSEESGFVKGEQRLRARREPEPDRTMDIRHPLIRQIGELTAELMGFRLLVVYPTSSGWGQIHGDSRADLQPRLCRLFQASPEGAKHCRMCHILMTAAACGGGSTERRCHAGASVMVCPAANSASESVAIVCSCMFVEAGDWKEIRARGEELGLDLRELRKAFCALPKRDETQRKRLQAAMETMAQAVRLVRRSAALETEVAAAKAGIRSHDDLGEWIEKTDWAQRTGDAGGRPLLIHVICELTRQRPDLPLTVKELAAAARLTPNHFTTLFREHVGKPFTDYLVEQRIERAQRLLSNPTLSISEIARQVGFDDPGYFSRRFHQKTGLSPREWRNGKAAQAASG